MKIQIGICLLMLGFFMVPAKAQNSIQEGEICISYLKNLRDTNLVNGIFKVTPCLMDENYSDKNYRAEYTQHIDDVEIESYFLLFKRKEKAHYVHSSSKLIEEENPIRKKFERKLKGTDNLYLVNPYPISLKNHVIRIYNFKQYNRDSTFSNGLTLKLDFCSDSANCVNAQNKNKYPEFGLIINNQLIATTSIFINEKTSYSDAYNKKYMAFIFKDQSLEDIEKYKLMLFNQTLYFNNEK